MFATISLSLVVAWPWLGLQGGDAARLHVSASAVGTNDGTSWLNAYVDLQDALDFAAARPNDDFEIWVAAGTYKPDRGTGDPAATFSLVSGVGLYGGFAGFEFVRDQRDPVQNETILSGDLLSNDDPAFVPTSSCCSLHDFLGCDDAECETAVCGLMPWCCTDAHRWDLLCVQAARQFCCRNCNPDRCDNSYHVVIASAVDSTTILDGFTISSGSTRSGVLPDSTGAGLLILASNPTIANCVFRNNASAWSGAAAISNAEGSTSLISDCLFTGNDDGVIGTYDESLTYIQRCSIVDNECPMGCITAQHSGAPEIIITDSLFEANRLPSYDPYWADIISTEHALTIVRSRFINNVDIHTIDTYGDALIVDSEFVGNSNGSLTNSGEIVIIDSRFLDNHSEWPGPGSAMRNYEIAHLFDCDFSGNSSDDRGGAIYNSFGAIYAENCRFTDNHSNKDGGAIYNGSYSAVFLSDCQFDGNQVRTAQYRGGAIANDWLAQIERSVFINNASSSGGGAIAANSADSRLFFLDCLFENNRAVVGGALYVSTSSECDIQRCAFFANESLTGGGSGLLNYGDTAVRNSIFSDNQGNLSSVESNQIRNEGWTPALQIDFSAVEGWTGALGGVGNTGDDPLFVDPLGPDGLEGTGDEDFRLSLNSTLINAGDPSYIPHPEDADLDGHARILCDRVDMGAYEFGIGDYNCDRIIELADFAAWSTCMNGPPDSPDHPEPYLTDCEAYEFHADVDDRIDLLDFAGFQNHFVIP